MLTKANSLARGAVSIGAVVLSLLFLPVSSKATPLESLSARTCPECRGFVQDTAIDSGSLDLSFSPVRLVSGPFEFINLAVRDGRRTFGFGRELFGQGDVFINDRFFETSGVSQGGNLQAPDPGTLLSAASEPGTLLLVGTGLLVLGFIGRRIISRVQA